MEVPFGETGSTGLKGRMMSFGHGKFEGHRDS